MYGNLVQALLKCMSADTQAYLSALEIGQKAQTANNLGQLIFFFYCPKIWVEKLKKKFLIPFSTLGE